MSSTPEVLINTTNQPVEVHLADGVVLALDPRSRLQVDLGAGPHPQLQELVSRLIVTVVPRDPEPTHPDQFTKPPFQGA